MLRPIARVKSRRNALLPVSRLPVEVLVEIVTHLLNPWVSSHEYPQKLRTLTLVCSQWHHIIDNAPTLWSSLCSFFPRKYTATSILKSKSSNLTIYQLDHYISDEQPHYATFMGQVLPEVRRWEVADICVDALDDQSLRLLEQRAPQLTSFSFDMSSWKPDEFPSAPLDLFGGYAPQLRTLELHEVPILWTSSILTGLRSLCLVFPTNKGPSALELLQMLQMCPDVTILKLVGWMDKSGPNSTSQAPNIELRRLAQLTLGGFVTDDAFLLLTSISAPMCVKVTLSRMDGEDAESLHWPSGSHLAQSFPTIHQYLQEAVSISIQDPGDTSVGISIGERGHGLEVNLADCDLSLTLDWLAKIIPDLKGKQANVEFDALGAGDVELWAKLDEWLDVVKFSTGIHADPSEIYGLLEYLAKPKVVSDILHWPFPNLVDLAINTEDIRPSRISKMVKSRYGKITWKSLKTVPRMLPKNFTRLYISYARENDVSRAAITKLVGAHVVTWEDEDDNDTESSS